MVLQIRCLKAKRTRPFPHFCLCPEYKNDYLILDFWSWKYADEPKATPRLRRIPVCEFQLEWLSFLALSSLYRGVRRGCSVSFLDAQHLPWHIYALVYPLRRWRFPLFRFLLPDVCFFPESHFFWKGKQQRSPKQLQQRGKPRLTPQPSL